MTYQAAAKAFGTISFEGCEYALTSQAEYTNRLLPGGQTNYAEAADGEDYDFEMSCPAIDQDGNEHTVYWIFTGAKGEDDPELDSYDYDDVDRVVDA